MLRLLVPRLRLPVIDVLVGELRASRKKDQSAPQSAHVQLEIYVTPSSLERIVIPFHKCAMRVQVPAHFDSEAEEINLSPQVSYPYFPRDALRMRERRVLSLTIDNTPSEVVIDGPGLVNVTGRIPSIVVSDDSQATAVVTLTVRPAGAEEGLSVTAELTRDSIDQPDWLYWKLRR